MTSVNRKRGQLRNASNSSTDSQATDPTSFFVRLRWPATAVILFLVLLLGAMRSVASKRLSDARQSIEQWRFEDASKELADYPWWGPNASEVQFLFARLARLQNGYKLSEEYLKVAQAGGFDGQTIARERALLEIQNGGISEKQLLSLDRFLQEAPNDRPAIYEAYAIGYLGTGRSGKGLDLLDRWSKEYPDDGRPFYWLGLVADDDDEALNMYSQATERDPNFFDAHSAQAKIWADRGEHQLAFECYRFASSCDPDRLDALVGQGEMLWKMRQYEASVKLLEPIAKEHPFIYPAGHKVASFYALTRSQDKVIETVKPMLPYFAENAGLNYMLASAYSATGMQNESQAALEIFLVANEEIDRFRYVQVEDVPHDELLRIAAILRRYDWENTLKFLKAAVRAQPMNAESHEQLAKNNEESGAISEAIRERNIAMSLK